MSHFDAIFDKICCLPACQQTLFCLQQCEVCQFFCYRFACGRHTRIDSFELILKIVWSVELFPLAQLHFLLMVFFFSEKYNIYMQTIFIQHTTVTVVVRDFRFNYARNPYAIVIEILTKL